MLQAHQKYTWSIHGHSSIEGYLDELLCSFCLCGEAQVVVLSDGVLGSKLSYAEIWHRSYPGPHWPQGFDCIGIWDSRAGWGWDTVKGCSFCRSYGVRI